MSRRLRKNILGSLGERSFIFQGAGSKDPPWGGLNISSFFSIAIPFLGSRIAFDCLLSKKFALSSGKLSLEDFHTVLYTLQS